MEERDITVVTGKHKKRVLFVINTMGRGGAEVAMLELMRALGPEKHEISLFVVLGQGELIRRVPPYVKVLNRSFDRTDVLSGAGKARLYRRILFRILFSGAFFRNLPVIYAHLLAMLRAHRLAPEKLLWRALSDAAPMSRKRYDLAIAYLEGASTYYVAEKVEAAKKAAFIHVDYEHSGYACLAHDETYAAFDRIFCVSGDVRDSFLKAYPEHADKTRVFHNIVDRDRVLEKADSGTGFSDGFEGARILTVGRLVPQKALEVSIDAMRILKDRGMAVRWYVIGEGDERGRLQRRVDSLGLQDDFLLLGTRDNPYPFFRECDIYAHCSRYEGRSVAVSEAKILGCPIIATDASGNRGQIRDGVDGLLVPLDPERIAGAIARLLSDSSLREKLSHAAAETGEERPDLSELFALL